MSMSDDCFSEQWSHLSTCFGEQNIRTLPFEREDFTSRGVNASRQSFYGARIVTRSVLLLLASLSSPGPPHNHSDLRHTCHDSLSITAW